MKTVFTGLLAAVFGAIILSATPAVAEMAGAAPAETPSHSGETSNTDNTSNLHEDSQSYDDSGENLDGCPFDKEAKDELVIG